MTTEVLPQPDTSHLFAQDSGPTSREQRSALDTSPQEKPRKGRKTKGRKTKDRSDRILSTRAATATEASGKRVLTRAALTSGFGGSIIAYTSMAFGPRFLASDVQILGIFIGLTMLGLALVAPLHPQSPKTAIGVFVVAGAIAAFPIAAGGYVIGSIVSVIGGSVLIAYEPPPPQVHVVVYRAGRIRRVTGLIVDFIIAFAIQRVLYLLLPAIANTSAYVYLSWVLAWFIAAVIPTLLTRRTGGRILVVLRVASRHTGQRAPAMKTLIRELLRGAIILTSFFALAAATLGTSLDYAPSLGMIAVLAVVGFVGERFFVMDRLTGTASVYDDILAGPQSRSQAPEPSHVPEPSHAE